MAAKLNWVRELIKNLFAPAARYRRPGRRPALSLLPEGLEQRLAPAAGLAESNSQLLAAYGQLPCSASRSTRARPPPRVQYLAHGNGYTLFLTATGSVLSACSSRRPTPLPPRGDARRGPGHEPRRRPIRRPSLPARTRLPEHSNYFVGNDSSQWHTGIANYGQVAYQDVYPGVNLVYYGNQQQLEYNFDVALRGADPGSIRFDVQGANNLRLDGQGNLVLHTATGDVLENAPVVYQAVGGVRWPVAGQFVLLGANEVGFQVGRR